MVGRVHSNLAARLFGMNESQYNACEIYCCLYKRAHHPAYTITEVEMLPLKDCRIHNLTRYTRSLLQQGLNWLELSSPTTAPAAKRGKGVIVHAQTSRKGCGDYKQQLAFFHK